MSPCNTNSLQHCFRRQSRFVGKDGHGDFTRESRRPKLISPPFSRRLPARWRNSSDQSQATFGTYGWQQDISYFGIYAPSFYDAIQAKVDKRFANSLQLVAHYMWSKNLSHDGGYDDIDPKVNYGPDDFNRKHVLSFSGLRFALRQGKAVYGNASRAANLIIGGFQLNTTTTGTAFCPGALASANAGEDQDVGVCRPTLNGGLFDICPRLLRRGCRHESKLRSFTPVAPLSQQLRHTGSIYSSGCGAVRQRTHAFQWSIVL